VLAVDLDDPTQVTPGTLGFITVFILALALIVLLRSMVGHLRKVRYQAEHEEAERLAVAEASKTAGQPPVEKESAAEKGAGASGPEVSPGQAP
jgi:hypothetical protein